MLVEPLTARARHRRALHKAGFRSSPTARTTWLWTAAAPPPAGPLGPAAASRAMPDRIRRQLAAQRLLADTAVRVACDVFGCRPDRLVLELPSEHEEDWWNDDDELLG